MVGRVVVNDSPDHFSEWLRFAQVSLDGQLVATVAEGHERTAERDAVDHAAHLHQPAGPEELKRVRPDEIGPATFRGALLQGRREVGIERGHLSVTSFSQARQMASAEIDRDAVSISAMRVCLVDEGEHFLCTRQ